MMRTGHFETGAVTVDWTDVEGTVVSEAIYAPDVYQAPHEHPFGSVSLVYRGRVRERVGRSEVTVGPMSVLIKPPGTIHSNLFGPTPVGTLHITRPADDPLAGDRWHVAPMSPVAARMLELLRSVRENDPAEVLEGLSLDTLAQARTPTCEEVEPSPPPRWLARIAERLDDTFTGSIRVSELAAQADVHPVVLARRFRRHYGTSITQRVSARRVERAAHLLAEARLSLAQVALACGFSDQSHLTRMFKRAWGETPGRFRALTRVH